MDKPELTQIDGIGEATANALVAAGIADVAALAAVKADDAPELKDYSGTLAWADWVAGAKALGTSVDAAAAAASKATAAKKTAGKKKAKADTAPKTPAASKPEKASTTTERRAFAINWSVRVGGTTFTPDGDRPKLTEEEHGQLLAGGAVDTPWLKGLKD